MSTGKIARSVFRVGRTIIAGPGTVAQVLGVNNRRIVAGFFSANNARCFLQIVSTTGSANGVIYVPDARTHTFTFVDFGPLVRGEWYCQSDALAVQIVAFEVYTSA